MSLSFIISIIAIIVIAFLVVKVLEQVIKARFFKIKSVLTATTAYDLCKLYKDRIISKKELLNELSHWIFVPEDKSMSSLKEDWRTILPPDPFGSFEDQIGKAYRDGLISTEIYEYLLKTYVTTDDINRDDDD